MTERLGYRHVSDLLREMSSAEITGWFAYLRQDREVHASWTAHAIAKAFNGDRKQEHSGEVDEEEVIDTTTPDFREHFKGFTNTKPHRLERR